MIFKLLKKIKELWKEWDIPKIYVLLFLISLFIFILLKSIFYEKAGGFFQGIIIEYVGMLFDIFVLGIIFSIFYKFTEKKRDIKRYREEIDDYRGWESDEAKFKIIGNIRRLNKLGFTSIDLSKCYLKKSDLSGLNLTGADLWETNFQDASLNGTTMIGANIECTNFKGANLSEANLQGAINMSLWLDEDSILFKETNFEGANLEECNLKDAQLMRANFKNVKLKNAELQNASLSQSDFNDAKLYETHFEGAILKYAKFQNTTMDEDAIDEMGTMGCGRERNYLNNVDFEGATIKNNEWLSIDELLKVKTLYGAELDPEFEKQIENNYPNLLKNMMDVG